MKALLGIWATRPANLPSWFIPGNEIEISAEQIMELYNSGSNVMLRHHKADTMFLFVDDRGFSQR